MAIITFDEALAVAKFNWGQQRNDLDFRSAFGSQSLEISAPLWTASIMSEFMNEDEAGAWYALQMQLRGKTNQLALWNLGRPVPRGTYRGGIALAAHAYQGSTSLQIISTDASAGKTLLQGDMLGIGSGITQQVVMVSAPAVSLAGGNITVSVEPPLRNTFTAGTALTWDKPKALFRRTDNRTNWSYETNIVESFKLDLVEDWRA